MKRHSFSLMNQQGAALMTSLVILMILSIIGIAFMGASIMSERMAGNEQIMVTTQNAAQSGNNAVMGALARSNLTDSTQIFQQLIAAATASINDSPTPFMSSTTGISNCLGSDGKLSTTCSASTKLDSGMNLYARSLAMYRGCSSLVKSSCAKSSINKCAHFVEFEGDGWYERSGNFQPTDGDDPMTTVENLASTPQLDCITTQASPDPVAVAN